MSCFNLFNFSSDLETGDTLANLTDSVHSANLALVLRKILGPGQWRCHAVGSFVDGDEAGCADVEWVVFIIV